MFILLLRYMYVQSSFFTFNNLFFWWMVSGFIPITPKSEVEVKSLNCPHEDFGFIDTGLFAWSREGEPLYPIRKPKFTAFTFEALLLLLTETCGFASKKQQSHASMAFGSWAILDYLHDPGRGALVPIPKAFVRCAHNIFFFFIAHPCKPGSLSKRKSPALSARLWECGRYWIICMIQEGEPLYPSPKPLFAALTISFSFLSLTRASPVRL